MLSLRAKQTFRWLNNSLAFQLTKFPLLFKVGGGPDNVELNPEPGNGFPLTLKGMVEDGGFTCPPQKGTPP